jgi:signal transduction histidine kinase
LAERYFAEHLKLAKQLPDDRDEEAHAYLNLADLFVAENRKPEAILAINKLLSIVSTTSGEAYGAKINFGFHFGLGSEAYAYNKLAQIFRLMNKNDSALQYNMRAIGIVIEHGGEKRGSGFNLYDVAAYYVNAGDIYNRLKLPDSALVYLRKGLFLADSIKHRELTRDAYEQFSISFALKRKFDSAYLYQLSFSKLRDSILNENSERDILQKEAALQMERQKRIQQTELSKQQLWRNVIVGISIFIILIVVLLYNRRRIKQKMVFQQQLNKQQKELMSTVIVVQDKERKRIAEDLHDTLGSILSAAKLKLSAIAEATTDSGNDNYDDTLNLLDEAVSEMRNISHNLLPASLLRLGLVAGLKNLIDKISSKSGLKINFIAYGFKDRLEETIEVSIYRIILETVNNVVKHAKAQNVTVQLVQHENYINILVEDDGVGFDKLLITEPGIGLNSILSRVDYMRGNIDIDTKPKAGTVINIDIPYRQKV